MKDKKMNINFLLTLKMQSQISSLKNTILESMNQLHSLNPDEANAVANHVFTEFSKKENFEVYKNEIKKKSTRLEASEYIEMLTSMGKITPSNGGTLFEAYEEHVRGFRHVNVKLHTGDSVDKKTGKHYEIKYSENDINTAMFHHIRPQDNIDFFIFAYRNVKSKTITYYKDIPKEIILKLIRHKEWKEKNRNTDDTEYDDFKDEIKTNDFDIRINGESRSSSINKYNYEMLKVYIVDSS
jgi:hypothetical protein